MRSLLVTLLILSAPIFSHARNHVRDTLIVDIQDIKPLVFADQETPTGFDIELWERIVSIKHTLPPFKYHVVSSFSEIIPRASKGISDLAICGVTITAHREHLVNFSHPYFKSGLAMLVRDEKETGAVSALKTYVNVVIKLIPLFLGYCVYLILAVLLVMWFERDNDMFPHFFDAAYWVNTVISSTGFGDKTAISKKGKILAQILMFTGIGFLFPMLTGTVTAELSAQRQEYALKSPTELRGKRVAVKRGTTSAAAVEKFGAITTKVTDLNQAAALLITEQVDAVVHDYPAVKYISKTMPGLVVIEKMFDLQDYGIVLPPDSPYRETINRALLTLRENGIYQSLYEKYFGEKE